MPGLGQLEGFSDGPDGSDSDDGSYTGGSDSESGSGSSGASTQESNVSEFTGPTAEASASAMADSNGSAADDDAKVAEAAADEAERLPLSHHPRPALQWATPRRRAPRPRPPPTPPGSDGPSARISGGGSCSGAS